MKICAVTLTIFLLLTCSLNAQTATEVVTTETAVISADSSATGTGKVSVQTLGGTERVVVENNGDVIVGRVGTDSAKLTLATPHPTVGYGMHTGVANFDGLPNYTMDFGWNCGAKTNAAERRLCWQFESGFRGNGGEWAEWHLQFFSALEGVNRRPIAFAGDFLTGAQQMQINGSFSVADRTGTIGAFFVSDNGPVQITNGKHLLFGVNDTSRIKQKSVLGGTNYHTLIYLDSNDLVNLGEGRPVRANGVLSGENVEVGTLKLKDSGILKTVTIGSADSCGIGHRCLRIAN